MSDNPSKRIRAAAVAVVAAVAVAAPSTAQPLPFVEMGSVFPRDEQAAIDAAQRRVDRLRVDLSTGRLEDAIVSAAVITGHRIRQAPVTARVEVPGLPPVIARPVDDLVAAVTTAERLVRQAFPTGSGPTEQDLIEDAVHHSTMRGVMARAAGRDIDRSTSDVDDGALRLMYSAGATVAAAIDRALPVLRRYAADLSPTGQPVSGCDVIDLSNLCLGGAGNNSYDMDKALLIDLGGADSYTNSAGGAIPDGEIGNGLPVSVNLDVAGDDVYEATPRTKSGAAFVQGVGIGGVGLLVDAGGHDRYVVHPDPSWDGSSFGITMKGLAAGQGLGFQGVGALVDYSGADRYRLDATGLAGRPLAQGMGVAGRGLGLLLDHGLGDDRYHIEAVGEPYRDEGGHLRAGGGLVNAFAWGESGAIVSDGGGDDTVSVRASGALPADLPNPPPPRLVRPWGDEDSEDNTFPDAVDDFPANIYAIAAGGILITGEGSTSYLLDAQFAAPYAANVAILGLGVFKGAAISDAGGDDTYVVRAQTRNVRQPMVNADCDCTSAHVEARAGAAWVLALAADGALLHDRAGNDQYMIDARSIAEAEVHDHGSGSRRVAAIAKSGDVVVHGQGFATMVTETQHDAAYLVDDSGNDQYVSRVSSDAIATASARSPDAAVEGHAVGGGQGFELLGLGGQGATHHVQGSGGSYAGHGRLIDRAGSDKYVQDTSFSALANPATTQFAIRPQDARAYGQGWDGGLLLDLGEGDDVFVQSPARTPGCYGQRGKELWIDCAPEGGWTSRRWGVGFDESSVAATAAMPGSSHWLLEGRARKT